MRPPVRLGGGVEMTPKFDYYNDEPRHHYLGGSKAGNNQNQQVGGLNAIHRDRFELLSAYLDGEVTAEESRQVRQWLETQPDVQGLYARLLKLREGIKKMPAPTAEQPVEKAVEGVFRRLDRHEEKNALDIIERDRFELVSAYLDGEVTAEERRLVNEWLDRDPQVKQLYLRLLHTRQRMQNMPVPQAEKAVEKTVERVFKRIDRRRQQALVWGGTAIAALFVAAMSSVMPGEYKFAVQPSPSPETKIAAEEPLMIALNRPLVEIRKGTVSPPDRSLFSKALIVE